MTAIRPLTEVRVYSRDPAHRAAFCAEMQPHTSARLQAVDQPRAVVEGADIVVCATGSNQPVFDGAWLQPGQHVTSIVGSNQELVKEGLVAGKRREIDDETVRRADLIGATLRAQAIQDEQGDLYDPVEAGLICWEDVHDLAAIVAGAAPTRTSAAQITLFKQNSDQGVGYMALARYVHDLARREGLGVEV
jgi:ornithine cyclodeaminase/alanine dehydrogenase-like protein (mu-crystallin family)